MSPDTYQRLAEFLDTLPAGFPATDSGVELKILKRLFTPEEAELTTHLSLVEETARVIALRAGKPLHEVAQRLEKMEKKGLVYARHKDGHDPLYTATHFVVGIYEFQLNKMDRELAGYFEEYLPHYLEPELWKEAPQLRTIPVGESLTPEIEVMPYEEARQIVLQHDRYSVANCICRQEQDLLGHTCDKPLETCLSFGSGADFYVRNGMGRYISREGVFEILELAEAKALVLQPGAAKESSFICTCCGCCCGVLANLKRHPRPAALAHTPFVVVHDDDLCDGCELCLERCQMEALFPHDGVVHVDLDRCIGCGLCVTTCPNEALALMRKPKREQRPLPRTWAGAQIRLAKARGVLSNRKMAEMFVRSRRDRALAADD